MPVVDISNIIRKLLVAFIKAMGSPFALFVLFAATIAGLAVTVVNRFNLELPFIDAIRVPQGWDLSLPFMDVAAYCANVTLFIRLYNWFLDQLTTLFVFFPTFTAAYIGACLVYKHSEALRREIMEFFS